jgi:hypothetical protein
MKCKNHPERDAAGFCFRCGRPFCDECLIESNGKNICKSCIDSLVLTPESKNPDQFFQQQSQSYPPGCSFDFKGHFWGICALLAFVFAIAFFLSYSPDHEYYWVYIILGIVMLIFSFVSALYYTTGGEIRGKLQKSS